MKQKSGVLSVCELTISEHPGAPHTSLKGGLSPVMAGGPQQLL